MSRIGLDLDGDRPVDSSVDRRRRQAVRTGERWGAVAALLFVSGVMIGRAGAATVPFTEDFSTSTSNWFTDSAGMVPPMLQASGGPDGGSFVSRTSNFQMLLPTDPPPALFRGQSNFGSSGGNLAGNWINDGVTSLEAFVRHDADISLTFFTRFATPMNFPAMVGVAGAPVAPGEWTLISIPIDSSPGAMIAEGPSTFDSVFSNLGNLQIGVLPGSLLGVDATIRFDLDKVSLVPEPTTLLLLLGGIGFVARGVHRRRHGGVAIHGQP